MPYCSDCGVQVGSGDTYCSSCGSPVGYSTSVEGDDDWDISATDVGRGSSSRETNFYLGAIVGVLAVLFLAPMFVLVALPEAIMAYWGKSIQDSMPRDARNNPFVSGTFLIFRWYGNFLLLLIALGIIAGLLFVALAMG